MHNYDPLAPNLSKIAGIPNVREAIEGVFKATKEDMPELMETVPKSVMQRFQRISNPFQLRDLYVKSVNKQRYFAKKLQQMAENAHRYSKADFRRASNLNHAYGLMADFAGDALRAMKRNPEMFAKRYVTI